MGVHLGRLCAKKRGRLGRRQGLTALASTEAAASRHAQAPSQAGGHFTSSL
jgi:hypothetical protein